MIRTQISVRDDQMRRLRDAAMRRNVSMAAIVRQAIDLILEADPHDRVATRERARRSIGAHRTRPGAPAASARSHDLALADIYDARAPRPRTRRRNV